MVRRSSPTRTTKRIAPEKSFFVLHDCYGTCIPGLEVAYDNEGSSGHGWRLDSKICEVLALTARAFCGSISLQIEIDSHNCSHTLALCIQCEGFLQVMFPPGSPRPDAEHYAKTGSSLVYCVDTSSLVGEC